MSYKSNFNFVFHINPAESEDELVKLILEFSLAGFPFSRSKVCVLAFQNTEVNNIKGFSKSSHKAGKKWMCFFLKHHPEIRIKKVHNLSVNRAMCVNPAVIKQFFDQYEALLKELKIDSLRTNLEL